MLLFQLLNTNTGLLPNLKEKTPASFFILLGGLRKYFARRSKFFICYREHHVWYICRFFFLVIMGKIQIFIMLSLKMGNTKYVTQSITL